MKKDFEGEHHAKSILLRRSPEKIDSADSEKRLEVCVGSSCDPAVSDFFNSLLVGERMLHSHLATVLASGIVIALAAPANAQSRSPDGTPSAAPRIVRQASRFNCGPLEYSKIVTDSTSRINRSTSFVLLPNASVLLNIAGYGSRCVKVTFTGETACSATVSGDYCYIRALDNGVELPPGDGFQAIDSENPTAQGHSFEWAARLEPGPHTIRIETRVRDQPTGFYIDDWTLDVQIHDLPLGDGS